MSGVSLHTAARRSLPPGSDRRPNPPPRPASPQRTRRRDACRDAGIVTPEEAMSLYITRGNYSAAALSAMMAKPEDRAEAVAGLLTAAGGKLHAFYFTFGESDFLLIAEAPSEN